MVPVSKVCHYLTVANKHKNTTTQRFNSIMLIKYSSIHEKSFNIFSPSVCEKHADKFKGDSTKNLRYFLSDTYTVNHWKTTKLNGNLSAPLYVFYHVGKTVIFLRLYLHFYNFNRHIQHTSRIQYKCRCPGKGTDKS